MVFQALFQKLHRFRGDFLYLALIETTKKPQVHAYVNGARYLCVSRVHRCMLFTVLFCVLYYDDKTDLQVNIKLMLRYIRIFI